MYTLTISNGYIKNTPTLRSFQGDPSYSTMPTYRVTYFNARGGAEMTRWIFAVAGIEYEDRRLVRDEWLKLKPGNVTCKINYILAV